MENLRKYGNPPFDTAVIHGGPGAPGEMAPVARELSSAKDILEPLQTSVSIQGQVKKLKNVLEKAGNLPVTLIGFSWGAWLSFIFASQHPTFTKKLILIGCGSFEEKYARSIMETRLSRLNENDREEVLSLIKNLENPAIKDKNMLLARFGRLIHQADSYDPLPHKSEILDYQYDIHQHVWEQASKLRSSGKLLDFGRKIQCPVIGIHGDYDPHSFEGVQRPLSRILKNFRFILLEKCGHKPWIERSAKDRFYNILKSEIRE